MLATYKTPAQWVEQLQHEFPLSFDLDDCQKKILTIEAAAWGISLVDEIERSSKELYWLGKAMDQMRDELKASMEEAEKDTNGG